MPLHPLPVFDTGATSSSAGLEAGWSLRDAMRRLVGGVCVTTAGIGPERTGATVTSARSLSVEPRQ
jgi:hypothetical protein